MADQKISEETKSILARGTWDEAGVTYRLPDEQYDRGVYEPLALVLKLLGGKWKGGKTAGFVFPRPARDLLDAALASGAAPDLKKRRQAYYTPETVVAQVMDTVFLGGDHRVLEPSAGGGAFAEAIRETGARLDCVEIDTFEAASLGARGFNVREADFLTVEPDPLYDYVIMNPPFTKGADRKHVEHALLFLKPHGILVSIVSPSFPITWVRDKTSELGPSNVEFDEIEAGAFKESGTGIATRLLMIRLNGGKSFDFAETVDGQAHRAAVNVIHGDRRRDIVPGTTERQIRDIVENEVYRDYRGADAELWAQAYPDSILGLIVEKAAEEVCRYFKED